MPKLEVFIYVKEVSESRMEFESILNQYWTFKLKPGTKMNRAAKKRMLNQIKFHKNKSPKALMDIYEKSEYKFGKVERIELVTLTKGRWVKGEYFAHEYSSEDEYGTYVPGRARKLTYSNGYTEYEIECLDKEYRVADGIWEEPDNNGCGDRFYANSKL